jgi:hypothetical protein
MKKANSSKFPEYGENNFTSYFIPPSEEKVVTEILFPISGNIVMKRINFSNSNNDPAIVIENLGVKVKTSFLLYHDSNLVAVSKILRNGADEKVISQVLITESGRIVFLIIDYSIAGETSLKILYPKNKVKIKSEIKFLSSGTVETKTVYYSESPKYYNN